MSLQDAGRPERRERQQQEERGTNWAQTKNGKRQNVSPLARSCTVVVRKLIAPRSDDVISMTMPMSHIVCPVPASSASGEYEVHPDCAAPPGTKKLVSMVTPPRK